MAGLRAAGSFDERVRGADRRPAVRAASSLDASLGQVALGGRARSWLCPRRGGPCSSTRTCGASSSSSSRAARRASSPSTSFAHVCPACSTSASSSTRAPRRTARGGALPRRPRRARARLSRRTWSAPSARATCRAQASSRTTRRSTWTSPTSRRCATRVEARRDWEASRRDRRAARRGRAPAAARLRRHPEEVRRRTHGHGPPRRRPLRQRRAPNGALLIEVDEFDDGARPRPRAARSVKNDVADARRSTATPRACASASRGDVAINVEETSALVSDLSLSSVVVVVLVVAVIVFYFQWWRSIVVLLPPLLLATIYSFALASLPPLGVTELNSNTAFLGSIIVGNGINFGIVLLARYVDERRAGAARPRGARARRLGRAHGTLSAALAAGVSYASLALTDFRGFRQFGFIGGIGMALSWLLAFVLMPPLVAWLDDRTRCRRSRSALDAHRRRSRAAAPRGLVARAAVLTLARALAGAGASGRSEIETDFSKLRRADTWTNGEGYWGRKMDALLGTYVTPTVILADDVDQARAIGRAVSRGSRRRRRSTRWSRASARSTTSSRPTRRRRSPWSTEIRDDLTPKIRASLKDDQRKALDRFLGNGPPPPADARRGPRSLHHGPARARRHRRAHGRSFTRRPGHALWQGRLLADFVARLRAPPQRAGRRAVPPAGARGRFARAVGRHPRLGAARRADRQRDGLLRGGRGRRRAAARAAVDARSCWCRSSSASCGWPLSRSRSRFESTSPTSSPSPSPSASASTTRSTWRAAGSSTAAARWSTRSVRPAAPSRSAR